MTAVASRLESRAPSSQPYLEAGENGREKESVANELHNRDGQVAHEHEDDGDSVRVDHLASLPIDK